MNLEARLCQDFPFDSLWHGAHQVDLRDNPHLDMVPRSLGQLDPTITKKVLLDFATNKWESLEEGHLAALRTNRLLQALALQMGCFFSLPSDKRLNFAYFMLTDSLCETLPFDTTWRGASHINFSGNPLLTRVPRCLRHLNPSTTAMILMDALQFTDRKERELAQCSGPNSNGVKMEVNRTPACSMYQVAI
jgi:hypothetical protein